MNDIFKAIDKALQNTEPDRTPVTTVFLSELRRKDGGTKRNYPNEILRDGRAVHFTDATIAQIAALAPFTIGQPLAAEPEIVQLRDLEKYFDSRLTEAAEFSLGKVSAYMHAHRDRLNAAVLSGNVTSVGVLPSRDSVSAYFRTAANAIFNDLVAVTHEKVMPIAGEILKRFDATIEAYLRQTEDQERCECEDWGVQWLPSVQWQAVVSIATNIGPSRKPQPWAWAKPSSILKGLVEL